MIDRASHLLIFCLSYTSTNGHQTTLPRSRPSILQTSILKKLCHMTEGKYPLYPAVAALIHENHIPASSIPKIPASGPNGRLLKGDVLSYLGCIQADYSST